MVERPQNIAESGPGAHRRPDTLGSPVPPADEMQRRLVSVWEEILGITPIGIDDDFNDLRGDSYAAVEIFTALEERYGIKHAVSLLFKHPTIRELAAVVVEPEDPEDDPRLVVFREDGDKAPFICIHSGGGEVFFAREALSRMAADRPVIAIRAATGRRVALPNSVEELAAEYEQAIRRRYPSGPYVIGGFCLGGAVALEIARNLSTTEDIEPPVIVIDGVRPGSFRLLPWLFFHLKEVRDSDWRGAVRYLVARVSTAGLRLRWRAKVKTPSIGPGEAVASKNAFTNAFVAAYGHYRPQPYGGQVFVLASRHMERLTGDDTLGWRSVALGGMHSTLVAETHWDLFGDPAATDLVPTLDEILSSLP